MNKAALNCCSQRVVCRASSISLRCVWIPHLETQPPEHFVRVTPDSDRKRRLNIHVKASSP